MTDISKMTDEELNEAIFIAKGWVQLPPPAAPPWQRPTEKGVESWFFSFPPDYTHDWRLCGELLEETMNGTPVDVGNVTDGYMVSWGCSYDIICRDLKRAICEAWLAWKEQG